MSNPISILRGKRVVFLLTLYLLLQQFRLSAQCNNWSINATLINGSTCAANGSFSVSLSGADVPNLTNIQYGIPLGPNGFSVPLNNASVFNNIPPGTYEVSAVAICGGASVGRTTHITVPGSYTPPTAVAAAQRPSLNCGPYGKMSVTVTNGRPPYTLTFTSVPNGYSGPGSYTFSGTYFLISSLPAGNYMLHVTDACGTGTTPQTVTINALDPATFPGDTYPPTYASCTALDIFCPFVINNNTTWAGYSYDTAFKYTAQISGGLSAPTPYKSMNGAGATIPLYPGHTLKECYGKTINYTIHPPCGSDSYLSEYIGFPSPYAAVNQDCNNGFKAYLNFGNLVCLPVSYTIHNTVSGANYGPYTSNSPADSTPYLPLGSYTVSYTTGDGYQGNAGISAQPMPGAPYQVHVINGSAGLNNYIEGFEISSSINVGNKTVELFSGPAGYSYVGGWGGTGNYYTISYNQTPVLPGTLIFMPGNYVWKVTDKCGSYLLPITVGQPDLYQFTAGISYQKQTCDGLWIWPTGTAINNGVFKPVTLSLMKNGQEVHAPNSNVWQRYSPGDSILINSPGVYTLVPSSNYYTLNLQGSLGVAYPNVYTQTYSFTYSIDPVQADMNKTQGFLCKGGLPGQAEIYVAGKNGIPFSNPTHYKYYLAHQGYGVSGPYISINTSGIFTGFGGNANDLYDVKIEDSCGAFSVQQIKILDLQTARAVSSSHYVTCAQSTIQLSAMYLPNATYSWTGPNGFTSNLREPVINNAGPQSAGVYYVTITSTECQLPVTDSTILTVNNNPPKPVVNVNCMPPVSMTITNPAPGFAYTWLFNEIYPGGSYSYILPSDTGYTLFYDIAGSYRAIATDTVTGCKSYSDSLMFTADPNTPPVISVYSPHLQLCPGDTTMLVVQTPIMALSYQWLLNGTPIPGATSAVYVTNVPGIYRMLVQTSICRTDTSAGIVISAINAPAAVISGTQHDICIGSSIQLQANTGTGYLYTWAIDGVTVPGAASASITATQPGNYTVVVANNGCAVTSAPYHINVFPHPVLNLTPATDQQLCNGDTVHFSTTADTSYTYTWLYNGAVVPGAATSHYTTAQPGAYQVRVGNTFCPDTTSQPVNITVLPSYVHIGNDTTICQPGAFSVMLTAGPGFSQVLWSTGETTPQITVSHSGSYWVKAVNACGSFTDTMHITALADYLPNLPLDTVICNAGNTATFSVPALLSNIHWSTGATTASIQVTQPGVYTVQGESPCGIVHDSVQVSFCAPHVNDLMFPASICEGDCIQPTAQVSQYPQEYHWYFPGGTPSFSNAAVPGSICYYQAGIYSVKLVVSNTGGTDSLTEQVTVSSRPHPRFKDTTVTVVYKSNVTLPACAAAQRVDWYKDSTLVCANCPSLKIEARYFLSHYHCVVTNGDCPDSCSYRLEVIDIPHDVWLPDAFTPNGDGRNDIFRIITDNPNVLVITLGIFDRWGQEVFGSHMNNEGWDGTMHGRPADAGVYFWMLRYKILGSEEVYSQKGDITLIR